MHPYCGKLLQQARHLCELDPHRPAQVNLRQAISCAYYALFHALVQEGSALLAPIAPTGLRSHISRKFVHGTMKDICVRTAQANCRAIPGLAGVTLLAPSPCGALKRIADAFPQLQDMRHSADYDLTLTFDKAEARRAITLAQNAIRDWSDLLQTNRDEATAFAAALLFGSKAR